MCNVCIYAHISVYSYIHTISQLGYIFIAFTHFHFMIMSILYIATFIFI